MRRAFFFATVLLIGAADAPAARAGDDAVLFKPGLKEMERYRTELKTALELVLLLPGAEADEGVPLLLERETAAVTRVLESSEGRPVKIEKTCEKAVESKNAPLLGGKTEKVAFEQGKTFEVTLAGGEADVRTTDDSAREPPSVPEKLKAELAREAAMAELAVLPESAVKAGHEWKVAASALPALLPSIGGKEPVEGSATLRLGGLSAAGGVKVAEIEVVELTATLGGSGESPGIVLEGSGSMKVALEKGCLVSIVLKGKARLKPGPGGVTGSGTFSVTLTRDFK